MPTDHVRAKATERVIVLVGEQEARSGSRMLAYTLVGRAIGKSKDWVRRLCAGQPVGLDAKTYFAATEAFQACCARMEARALKNMKLAEEAMEEAHASLTGRIGLDPGHGSVGAGRNTPGGDENAP